MKIPIEWLKEYVNTKKSPREIAESFTSLGLLLDKPIENNVLDLEHRMDRSDWLSITGCARDLAAFEGLELKNPELHNEKGKEGGGVAIRVEVPELCRRFNTRVFRGVTVKESPEWLKKHLEAYGMTPINNIVDITNYVMVELGNPLHAQDLDKFERQEIVIRKARPQEKITTLDGTAIELDNSMFVLSQNNEAITIGGVVGGAKTAVTAETKDIVLDAGNYYQANIRKTARKLKIQNETVLRYDKFLHPENTQVALERAAKLILELAGGEYYENEDYYPKPVATTQMPLRLSRVKALSGLTFEMDNIRKILTSLGYKILEEKEAEILVEVPYFRTDVQVEDDIVADILRINDYKNIPARPINAAPPKETTPNIYKLEEELRNAAVSLGLHEHITDPLVSADKSLKNQVLLENSFSTEKNALRTSLYKTLAPVVQPYYKQGIKKVKIFEIGAVYEVEKNSNKYENYREIRVMTAICKKDAAPYEISKTTRKVLSGLLFTMDINNVKYEKHEDKTLIRQKNNNLGYLTYDSFTLYTENLLKAERTNVRVVGEHQNIITEDISITLDLNKPFGPVYEKIKNFDPEIYRIRVADEYFDKEKGKKSILVRLEFLEKQTSMEKVYKIKEGIEKSLANL
jgi:phenylalanyl-tRNA synthetase beta chain